MTTWKNFVAVLLILGAPLPVFSVEKPGVYLVAGKTFDATTAADFGLAGLDNSLSALLTDAGRSKFGGTIAIGYAYPLSPKYVVMIETGKDTGTSTGFTTAALLTTGLYSSQIDREWQFRRNWFFAIKPAIRLSDASLVYLSLSHHHGSVTGRSDMYLDCTPSGCASQTSFSGSGRLSGTGTGLGLQTTIEKNWFVRVEVERIRFNQFTASVGDPAVRSDFSTESLRPLSTVGRLMVGYRF